MAKGVPEEKIEIVYNWINEDEVVSIPREENKLCEKYGIGKDKFIVTYSGNIGHSQNIEMLAQAAEMLQDKKDILFGVKSTENEEVIVEGFEVPKKEIPKLDEWALPFGKKHKGKTLPQILEIDPEYILWAKENITSEPAKSLLKQL